MRRRRPAGAALAGLLALAVAACAAADAPSPVASPAATPITQTQTSPPASPTSPPTWPPGSPAGSPNPPSTATAPAPATLPPPVAGTPPPQPTSGSLPTEPVEAPPVDEELAPVLQALLDDWLSADGAPGAVLGVRLPDGRTVVVAAGETDVGTGRAVDPGNRFRIGSITKTFVAALVVGLAEEGLLALGDPLARYLPEAPHAAEVTVRQLLDHTSGLPDFAAQPSYRVSLLRAPGREWQPEDTVALVAPLDLMFEPASRWAYSNTNYVLLGMLAEEVTGEPLATLLRQRVYEPLGLESTYLEGLEDSPPMAVSGHFDLDGDGTPDNVRAIPYTALVTSGSAAGGITASALDVLDFASALFGGRLVPDARLAEMMELGPGATDYGAGLARFRPAGVEAWGHSGALPGFSTLMVHTSDGLSVVAMANETGSAVSSLVGQAVSLAADR